MFRRTVVVPAIITINIAVYLAWSWVGPEFMFNHFTVSMTALRLGQYWTLLTSEFSHTWVVHLALNMFVLKSFGSLMERVLGRSRFLLFYLWAAIVASLCHCLVSAYYLGQPDVPAVGASGAIVGLLLLFSLRFPKEKILLFFVIPLPALLGALVFVGLDIWGLIAQAGGGGLPIGHGAHLGGALAGAVYYFARLRGRARRLS